MKSRFGMNARRGLLSVGTLGLLALGAAGVQGVNASPSEGEHAGNQHTAVHHSSSAGTAAARELSNAFREAVDRVMPSVVTIETNVRPAARMTDRMPGRDPRGGERDNPFRGTPWEDLFERMPGNQGFRFEMPREMPRQGSGSGVVIDREGLIMTNHHVVDGAKASEITVRLADGREFTPTEVWKDPKTDVAIIKVPASDLPAAELGDSDQVAVGDWVLALGQPFGLESSVTAGIISATHRGVGIAARESFLQTDAAINPGNSGGPLVNLDGHVIGINTAISSRSGGNDGVGFAIPINMANWVGKQLAEGGVVRRAFLGVGIQPMTASMAQEFRVKPHEGVVVTEVREGTPAAKAGLQVGDVITKCASRQVNSPQELQVLVESSTVGKEVPLTVVRDGKTMEIQFVPQEQPANLDSTDEPSTHEEAAEPATMLEALGLEIRDLDQELAGQLGLRDTTGVVITDVSPDGPAARSGLQAGMVITQIERQSVSNVKEAEKLLTNADRKDGILLLVKSSEGSRFVVVKDAT